MKTIRSIDDMRGQELKDVIYSWNGNGILLQFKDGDIVCLQAGHQPYTDYELEVRQVAFDYEDYHEDEVINLGIMTKQEIMREEEAAHQESLRVTREREYSEYLRLREKFKGDT